MKKILFTIFFLIISLIFSQPASATDSKVAVIGSSSFTAGCAGSGFVNQLRKAYPNKTFDCFVKNGENTAYFKNQFNQNVKGKNFNELIIYAGLNGLTNLSDSQKHLTEIFQAAEIENITTIVISAQPFLGYSTWTEEWGNNLIQNHQWLATRPHGIDYFVDIYSIVQDNNDQYKMNSIFDSGDHLHMNQKGQDLMFEKISEIYDTGSISNSNAPSSVTLTAGELKNMVSQPTLQIQIPGLNFKEGIEIVKEEGTTYIYSTFFQEYIVAIYKYAVIAISILAVLMIVVAGIQWLISGGSPDKIKSAQKKIGGAIIGIILAAGSYTILFTINPYLVGFNAIKTQYFEDGVYEKGEIDEASLRLGKSADFTGFDEIFKLYQPCLEVDWKILKAVAYAESRFNPKAKSPTSFQGLFQTTVKNCKGGYLDKYSLASKCDDINDPEVSTMVGVSSLIAAKKIVESICPNASFESKIFFMYTCHHSGQGGCTNVMQLLKTKSPTCDYTLAEQAIYEARLKHKGKTVEEDNLIYAKYLETKDMKKYYSAKMHAQHGVGGGLRTLAAAKQYGATMSYISNDMNNCPLKNHNLIGTSAPPPPITNQNPTPAIPPTIPSGVKLVGHRGSNGPVVPNTKEAFTLGAQRGYFALEADIRVSKDNQYYICHDDVFKEYLFVDYSSLKDQKMSSYTWDKLKILEIKNGQYISNLTSVDEYLDICKRYNIAPLLELKYTNGINNNSLTNLPGLITLVKNKGLLDKAIFMSAMKEPLKDLRIKYPDLQLQYLSDDTSDSNIEFCIKNKLSLDIAHDKITPEVINKMHQAGLLVNTYTVSDKTKAQKLKNMGVDMITTDTLLPTDI